MEEMKNGTLATEQPIEDTNEQATQTQEDITKEVDDFWGPSKEQEGGQPEEGQETQAQEQDNQYYTPEEIQQIGIDRLDPNRIPPELQPFYKSMQADYTRKTQAVAQERRTVERLLDKALSHPELARDFMSDPELIGLAQQHPELAQKLQAVSHMAQPQTQQAQNDPFMDIAEEARKEFEERYGVEYDPLDDRHTAAYHAIVAAKTFAYQQQAAMQQAINQKLQEIQLSEPHFAEIDAYAEQKLWNMPAKDAMEIIHALETGENIDAALKFWDECRKEWYEQNLHSQSQAQVQTRQPTQNRQQPAPQPPPVETGGSQQVNTEENPDEIMREFFGL